MQQDHAPEAPYTGLSSYRLTSFLMLSYGGDRSVRGAGDLKPYDPFDKSAIVATDRSHAEPTRRSKMQTPQIGVDYLMDKIKARYQAAIGILMRPVETLFVQVDQAIDMIDKAIMEMGFFATSYMQAVKMQVMQEFARRHHGNEMPAEAPADAAAPPPPPPVSFTDLKALNVEFTDNYDRPLFDFSRYKGQYQISRQIVDPIALEVAVHAIRECAERASSIPPAAEGPYAQIPLSTVMSYANEDDLQGFLRYVKAYPGNYVGRNLKISETFATWVIYGAPSA